MFFTMSVREWHKITFLKYQNQALILENKFSKKNVDKGRDIFSIEYWGREQLGETFWVIITLFYLLYVF